MSASRQSATAIAARYATAMFALAEGANAAPQLVEEVSALATAMQENPALASALASPVLGRAAKAEILVGLAKGAHATTARALQTIAAQGRAALLPAIAALLRAKLAESRNEITAQVESARPLPARVQQQLVESLQRATGKKVQLNLTENPALLGGVAVQIGSQRLDATLAAALATMRRDLLGAAV